MQVFYPHPMRQIEYLITYEQLLSISEETFIAAERFWPFNKYLEALQVLQEASGLEAELFYEDLLRTPLALRPGAVRAMKSVPEFLPLFARTIGKLR